jgi:hypothetical protein
VDDDGRVLSLSLYVPVMSVGGSLEGRTEIPRHCEFAVVY